MDANGIGINYDVDEDSHLLAFNVRKLFKKTSNNAFGGDCFENSVVVYDVTKNDDAYRADNFIGDKLDAAKFDAGKNKCFCYIIPVPIKVTLRGSSVGGELSELSKSLVHGNSIWI